MNKREYIQANKDWLEASFYTDITEEPLIAGQFLVYSGPTVLLLMDGKEVYRGSQFIDLEELEYNINRFLTLSEQ